MSTLKAPLPPGTVTVIPPAPKATPGDGKPGPGRPKGSTDKIGRSIREMVQEALNRSGQNLGGDDGTKYFELLAITEPKAFAMLVGKCIPLQIGADPNSPPIIQRIERVIVQPQVTVRVVQPAKK